MNQEEIDEKLKGLSPDELDELKECCIQISRDIRKALKKKGRKIRRMST
ncbi:hypothetical protein KA005_18385 [bacterium]|nr:hypothetical protein [bacterium]